MAVLKLAFGDYLREVLGRSPRTVAEYERDVASFAQYCADRGLEAAAALSSAQVSLFVMQRTAGSKDQASISQRSAARAVSSLKAWQQYLRFAGLDQRQEGKAGPGLAAPKYGRALPVYFSAAEIRGVVTAFDSLTDPVSLRNSAILHILYSCGLRVSECAGLQLSDLRGGERVLTVLGKGSKQREAPYGSVAAARVELYLAQGRPHLAVDAHSARWLWLGRTGRRLTVRRIQQVLDRAALLSGVLKPVSPHKLRHACATHMLEGGADIRLLQELLGHSSLNTTQIYTQITRTQLLDVYSATHPRALKRDE